ncbi:hypothetical protein CVT26_011294 [Gymnopilus dilepis]|uniref:Uncharacterized protein n=1 Tax=Gymnopilus dilepis TaxID=231916 RepID=A0A409X215_9AGAR|nr:hypothetical protein CVT26_011294 [Gymnopilus dilepis]
MKPGLHFLFAIAVGLLTGSGGVVDAQSTITTPNPPASGSASPAVTSAAVDLLDANHILHFLDVVDAFGHISTRNPDNSSQFIMYVIRHRTGADDLPVVRNSLAPGPPPRFPPPPPPTSRPLDTVFYSTSLRYDPMSRTAHPKSGYSSIG